MRDCECMKKMKGLIFVLVCFVFMVGCGKNNTYEMGIVVSPDEIEVGGYQEELDYSDEEISPIGNKIVIYGTQSLADASIALIPTQRDEKTEYQPTYITPGMPVEFEVEAGKWYKIGVAKYNGTDTDKIVYVEVEGVEVRIE